MSVTADSLHHLVPTFRRDTDEVIGAVRRSAVEFIGMEQMPGGKFQITARTASGADAFVSAVTTSLRQAHEALEFARRSFGGEPIDVPIDLGGISGSSDELFLSLTAAEFAQGHSPADETTDSPSEAEFVELPPRRPTFAFAEIDVPELPTSVR